jgi:hypothetical protein
MANTTGLPSERDLENTVLYFNSFYGSGDINYTQNEVDAVVGYFLKRGFDQIAAVNTGGVLLEQAKRDSVPVFKLLDTLEGINDVQLSNVVAQIINANRRKTSSIGYKQQSENQLFDQRNIIV